MVKVLKVKSLVIALLGMVMMVPVYVMIRGAPVFYVQLAAIVLAVVFYAVRHSGKAFSPLDQMVAVYLAWALLSVLANVPVFWLAGRADRLSSQLISLFALLLTVSPYLLGRYYCDSEEQVRLFIKSIAVGFTIVLCAVSIFYAQNLEDLFLARATIKQRIPMMFTFVVWGVCGLCFWSYRWKPLLWFLWFAGSAVVVLSLTRACYLQWLASAAAFAMLSIKEKLPSRPLLPSMAVLGVLVAALLSVGVAGQRTGAASVVLQRAEMLLSLKEALDVDESATGRVEVWRRLGHKLQDSPVRLAVGFGQLGPSNMAEEFTSISGERLTIYDAHNQYLDTVIRSGLVGLFLELLLVGLVLTRPLLVRKQLPDLRFFQAHSAALMGVLVYGVFHETLRWQMFGFYFWLYAGIVSAHLYRREGPAASHVAT